MQKYGRLLAGVVILLFLGISMAWSILVVPIETTYGWTRSQTSLAFTINVLCFSVGSFITGVLQKKLSFANILRIAGFMIFGGFMGLTLMSQIWQLFLLYGILIGTAVGMGYNAILSVCPSWLPASPAIATGILLVGYAFSVTIFGTIINTLISGQGMIFTFRFLAFICLIAVCCLSFFIRMPKEGEVSKASSGKTSSVTSQDMTTGEMIRQPKFWLFYIFSILAPGMGLAFINHNAPLLTEEFGVTSAFAAAVVSAVAMCNGLGRFSYGLLYGKLGLKRATMFIGYDMIAASLIIILGFMTGIVPVYILGTGLLLLGYGCSATTFPTAIREMYGSRYFSSNYSILTSGSLLCGLFPTVIGVLQRSSGSYLLPLYVLAGITIVNLVIIILFNKTK